MMASFTIAAEPGGRPGYRHGSHAREPLAESQLTRFTANLCPIWPWP